MSDGKLTVVIVEARGIKNTATLGTQDPYCSVQFSGHTVRTPTCDNGGTTPKWGGVTFKFPIAPSGFDTDLWLNVKAEGVLSSTLCGFAKESVRKWCDGKLHDVWIDLRSGGKVRGQLHIRVKVEHPSLRPAPVAVAAPVAPAPAPAPAPGPGGYGAHGYGAPAPAPGAYPQYQPPAGGYNAAGAYPSYPAATGGAAPPAYGAGAPPAAPPPVTSYPAPGGYGAPAAGGYGAPASGGYGAPASGGYGAPAAPASYPAAPAYSAGGYGGGGGAYPTYPAATGGGAAPPPYSAAAPSYPYGGAAAPAPAPASGGYGAPPPYSAAPPAYNASGPTAAAGRAVFAAGLSGGNTAEQARLIKLAADRKRREEEDQRLAMQLAQESSRAFRPEYDTNGDGVVSLEEYRRGEAIRQARLKADEEFARQLAQDGQ